nr:MAG TPA: hypothetical protein [Caudoviricetes sp.]
MKTTLRRIGGHNQGGFSDVLDFSSPTSTTAKEYP